RWRPGMQAAFICLTHWCAFLCAVCCLFFFFFQAEDGIRDGHVTGVQTCALPILPVGANAVRALFEVVLERRRGRNGAVARPCDDEAMARRVEPEAVFRAYAICARDDAG